jgi:hypothetical protein
MRDNVGTSGRSSRSTPTGATVPSRHGEAHDLGRQTGTHVRNGHLVVGKRSHRGMSRWPGGRAAPSFLPCRHDDMPTCRESPPPNRTSRSWSPIRGADASAHWQPVVLALLAKVTSPLGS